MTNTVARLRKLMEFDAANDWDGSVVMHDDLTALLDVVERFAAVEPVRDAPVKSAYLTQCALCGVLDNRLGTQKVPSAEHPHADDCPWLAARRLCGMEDDAK